MGIAKNRSCSINAQDDTQVKNLQIRRCSFSGAAKKFWVCESILPNLLPLGRRLATANKNEDK